MIHLRPKSVIIILVSVLTFIISGCATNTHYTSAELKSVLLTYDYWVVVQKESCPESYSYKADGTMKSNDLGLSTPNHPQDYHWSINGNILTLTNSGESTEKKYTVSLSVKDSKELMTLTPLDGSQNIIWRGEYIE